MSCTHCKAEAENEALRRRNDELEDELRQTREELREASAWGSSGHVNHHCVPAVDYYALSSTAEQTATELRKSRQSYADLADQSSKLRVELAALKQENNRLMKEGCGLHSARVAAENHRHLVAEQQRTKAAEKMADSLRTTLRLAWERAEKAERKVVELKDDLAKLHRERLAAVDALKKAMEVLQGMRAV